MIPQALIDELKKPAKEMPNWEVTARTIDGHHHTYKVERVEITPRGVQIILGKDTTVFRQ